MTRCRVDYRPDGNQDRELNHFFVNADEVLISKIIDALGYLASQGETVRAVKMARQIFMIGLKQAKQCVFASKAEWERQALVTTRPVVFGEEEHPDG